MTPPALINSNTGHLPHFDSRLCNYNPLSNLHDVDGVDINIRLLKSCMKNSSHHTLLVSPKADPVAMFTKKLPPKVEAKTSLLKVPSRRSSFSSDNTDSYADNEGLSEAESCALLCDSSESESEDEYEPKYQLKHNRSYTPPPRKSAFSQISRLGSEDIDTDLDTASDIDPEVYSDYISDSDLDSDVEDNSNYLSDNNNECAIDECEFRGRSRVRGRPLSATKLATIKHSLMYPPAAPDLNSLITQTMSLDDTDREFTLADAYQAIIASQSTPKLSLLSTSSSSSTPNNNNYLNRSKMVEGQSKNTTLLRLEADHKLRQSRYFGLNEDNDIQLGNRWKSTTNLPNKTSTPKKDYHYTEEEYSELHTEKENIHNIHTHTHAQTAAIPCHRLYGASINFSSLSLASDSSSSTMVTAASRNISSTTISSTATSIPMSDSELESAILSLEILEGRKKECYKDS